MGATEMPYNHFLKLKATYGVFTLVVWLSWFFWSGANKNI